MRAKDIRPGKVYFNRFRELVRVVAPKKTGGGWWYGVVLFTDGRRKYPSHVSVFHSRAIAEEVIGPPAPALADEWHKNMTSHAINEGENRYRQTVLSQGPLPGYPIISKDSDL